METRTNGIILRFEVALDRSIASEPDNFNVEQWNYRWTREYGSPDFSVRRPSEKGRDPLTVSRTEQSPDGKELLVKIEDLRPAMQTRIKYRLKDRDGVPMEHDIDSTIHRLR